MISPNGKRNAGFTLLENLIIVVVLGVLASTASSSWLRLLDSWRLAGAQAQIKTALHEARLEGRQEKRTMQFSIRETGERVEFAMHPKTQNPQTWTALDDRIELDEAETTFRKSGGVRRMLFNWRGVSGGQLGRVTVKIRGSRGRARRCVFVSTLLGHTRNGKEQRKAQNGRYCY